jgi:hypothetical protein
MTARAATRPRPDAYAPGTIRWSTAQPKKPETLAALQRYVATEPGAFRTVIEGRAHTMAGSLNGSELRSLQ